MDLEDFQKTGREYMIKESRKEKTPTTWSHILANEKFGTVITNHMGGFTYAGNSRLNRITSWANTPNNDIPSEVIYLKDLDYGEIWTLNDNVMPDEEDYYITFGFGYAKTYHASFGMIQETEIFVPKEDNAKISILRLKNVMDQTRKLKLIYYLKPVLGEDETKTNGYLDLDFDQDNNMVFVKNRYGEHLSKMVYVASSEKITSYTGSDKSFIGNGNLSKPDGIYQTRLSMENAMRRGFLYCDRIGN